MTKVVRNLQIPSSSITQTTEPNYGVVYASASSVYFTNDSGQTFDLTKSTAYTNIVYFTGSADRTDITYQWNKPPGIRYLEVCAVGAGGGGSTGYSRLADDNYQGGMGGGGGAVIWASFPSFLLTDATYSIGIQRGGAGGSGSSGALFIGVNGSPGGTSSFSDSVGNVLVLARGGGGGFGGSSANSKVTFGGYISSSIPISSGLNGSPPGMVPNVPSPGNTRSGTPIFDTLANINGADAAVGEWGNGGGGGGNGGCISGSNVATAAGSGSNGYQYNQLRINNRNGTSFPGVNDTDGGPGTDNLITTLLRYSGSIETQYGLGGGGHGGGASLTGISGRGGDAGFYGAGGGGSGASAVQRVGTGGSGSAGLVILTEYYF